MTERLFQREAAERVGVSRATLRRWVAAGVLPRAQEGWTEGALAQARIVARLRERGHPLREIREATESGRLAFAYIDALLPLPRPAHTIAGAADATGLEPALIERILAAQGVPAGEPRISDDDLQLLRYVSAVLEGGLPLVALLQLLRVYGQALAQVADAEVRLFHLYVHEPLMREGAPGVVIAEQLQEMVAELLPLASPVMDQIHQRFLRHFVEQDTVGHMETDLEAAPTDLGRLRITIGFADLAGYTRLTEEAGEEEAVSAVERFVELLEATLPEEARVVKTIGDGVMIVGSDAAALVDWAVGFQALQDGEPLPRIGLHKGVALYRDGDYFGRDVNLASRVVARAAGGEVIVTRPVVEAAGPHLEFRPIGEVRLKGFSEPTELFAARAADDG